LTIFDTLIPDNYDFNIKKCFKKVHISLYTTILNILVLLIKYILLNIENIEKVLTEY